MPGKSFWNQFGRSLAQKDFYGEVITWPKNRAIMYLLTLTFIVSLLVGVKLAVEWNSAIDAVEIEFASKAPEFLFKDGLVTVNAPMPYIIAKTNEEIFIVDTSGKLNETVLKGYQKGIFIGKSIIVEKKDAFESRTYDLANFKNITFNKADVAKYIPWLKWAGVLIGLALFIGGFIANLVAAAFVGACGLLAAKIMGVRAAFGDLYKISIYALTLPLMLELAVDLTAVKIPLFKLIFYVIAIIYVVMALRFIKQKADSMAEEPLQ